MGISRSFHSKEPFLLHCVTQASPSSPSAFSKGFLAALRVILLYTSLLSSLFSTAVAGLLVHAAIASSTANANRIFFILFLILVLL